MLMISYSVPYERLAYTGMNSNHYGIVDRLFKIWNHADFRARTSMYVDPSVAHQILDDMTDISSVLLSLAIALLLFNNGLLLDSKSMASTLSSTHYRVLVGLAVTNYIAIPVLAILLLAVFPGTREGNTSILIMAAFPCAPFVPALATHFNEPPGWPLVVFFLFSMLNLLMLLPLLFMLHLPSAIEGMPFSWSTLGLSTLKYLLSVYLPLLLGVLARAWRPGMAMRYLPGIQRAVAIFSLAVVFWFAVINRRTLYEMPAQDVLTFIAFEIICLVCTAFLGVRFGGSTITRISTGTLRNFAMAAAFATVVLPTPRVTMYIIVFSTIAIICSVACAIGSKSLPARQKVDRPFT